MPNYWLMKAEPAEASIDDVLAMPNATVPWTGVRNYQARNFMRDGMQRADAALQDLTVLKKGNRLSITPVSSEHWQTILQRLGSPDL